ncbi:MAG: hypothetical protein R3Y54_09005 [Eubacteriales bacterium]
MEKSKISKVISSRDEWLKKERLLCVATIENLNLEYKELLNNEFGTQLVKNSLSDLAGDVCRRYFDMGDLYLTADQLVDRVLHFSYENDRDILGTDNNLKKAIYNYSDDINSKTLSEISKTCKNAQQQLFVEDRKNDKRDRDGKKAYRESKKTEKGELYDELTGEKGGYSSIVQKNGKEYKRSELDADHILSRESITYNSRYIREDKLDIMKDFYNSSDNFLLIHASANSSKRDVRVCEKDGKIFCRYTDEEGYDIKYDITYKATPEQLAEATIQKWEKNTASGNKIKNLKEKGYLDENGKVVAGIKKKLIEEYKQTMNKESMLFLKTANYKNISADALSATKQSVGKIIAGQVIYYTLPPVVFETQRIVKKKNISIDNFYKELKKSGKRIVNYVASKLKEMFGNVFFNSINKFIKTFFDIVIEMVRATVKRMLKIVKSLVLSMAQCAKILVDKKSDAAQKADSITKILSVTTTTVVMELLFEYLEKQFGLPNFLMEPLQVIVTIIANNVIMLVLQKADLFNVQYGLLVANIDKIFEDNRQNYLLQSDQLLYENSNLWEIEMNNIQNDIVEIRSNFEILTPYDDGVINELEKINELFDMKLDFENEWNKYIGVA